MQQLVIHIVSKPIKTSPDIVATVKLAGNCFN